VNKYLRTACHLDQNYKRVVLMLVGVVVFCRDDLVSTKLDVIYPLLNKRSVAVKSTSGMLGNIELSKIIA
jgi:hypothetical protein